VRKGVNKKLLFLLLLLLSCIYLVGSKENDMKYFIFFVLILVSSCMTPLDPTVQKEVYYLVDGDSSVYTIEYTDLEGAQIILTESDVSLPWELTLNSFQLQDVRLYGLNQDPGTTLTIGLKVNRNAIELIDINSIGYAEILTRVPVDRIY
jgi:hypothetical protein